MGQHINMDKNMVSTADECKSEDSMCIPNENEEKGKNGDRRRDPVI
jgi:hypothetical protein